MSRAKRPTLMILLWINFVLTTKRSLLALPEKRSSLGHLGCSSPVVSWAPWRRRTRERECATFSASSCQEEKGRFFYISLIFIWLSFLERIFKIILNYFLFSLRKWRFWSAYFWKSWVNMFQHLVKQQNSVLNSFQFFRKCYSLTSWVSTF